jgi:hypothetical protein
MKSNSTTVFHGGKFHTTCRTHERFGTTTTPTTLQSYAVPGKYLEGSLGEVDELTDSCLASDRESFVQKTMPLGFACLDCIMLLPITPHLESANREYHCERFAKVDNSVGLIRSTYLSPELDHWCQLRRLGPPLVSARVKARDRRFRWNDRFSGAKTGPGAE